MAWTFDLVMHRPGAVARIISEAAVGEHAFTDAAIKESLRLRPPVIAAGRVTNQIVELGPWRIPEGVRIWTPMSLIQRDPEIFDRPNEFRPERYLDEKPPEASPGSRSGAESAAAWPRPFAHARDADVVQQVLSKLRLTPSRARTSRRRVPRARSSSRATGFASGSRARARARAVDGHPLDAPARSVDDPAEPRREPQPR